MKMNRSLVILTMGFVLSLMLLSSVSGSTSVNQADILSCNGHWYQATTSGNLQINVCTPVTAGDTNYSYGNDQSVQYSVSYNQASVASGVCGNLGPCSSAYNPTVAGVEKNSYLLLRFYPGDIYGMQIIGPDGNGNVQRAWLPYNGGYPGYQTCNPNPDVQFCFAQNYSYCSNAPQGCSAVVLRIEATPITINVFFNQPN